MTYSVSEKVVQLKIQKYLAEKVNTNRQNNDGRKYKTSYYYASQPSFKAGALPVDGMLNLFGGAMQWIQDQGFLASFLIQDVLGMTAPRVGAAFLRDKEVTGKYNVQEGFEVLGREGLTGPCMMAVAPIMFMLSAKFGKTTTVNSRLIKRFGNSLKEIVSKQSFDKNILKDKAKFKSEFYKINIEKMLKDSLGEKNVTKESVDFILEKMSKYENSNNKVKNQALNEIVEHIDNIRYNTSANLENLNKISVGNDKIDKVMNFSTKEAIEALIKFSDDAITFNKHLESLDSLAAENLRDTAIAKRFLANISTIAATLGLMGVLPKIYARSNISPGAVTAMQMKENNNNTDAKSETSEQSVSQDKQVAFKGKNNSMLSKLGKLVSKFTNDKLAGELEYNGHNFTNTLMAGLSLFGLLAPRGKRAYDRAQVDENGKKDLTELYEILIRDVSSSLSVVFLVPMLTRMFVTSYENSSGFVLIDRDRTKTGLKKFLELINPYSSSTVLSNAELTSLYNGVNSQEKMVNFCKFIDKNNGDLQKILSKSENIKEVLKEKPLDLEGMKNLSKSDKNRKILEYFENLGKDGKLSKESIDKMITKIMKNAKNPKANKIASFAKGLNSIPAIITTFLISPYILGWVIPRFTYANTRRLHAEAAEKEQQQNKLAKSA